MKCQRLNFPDVIPDNETTYLNYLEGLVESVDLHSDMMIYRGEDSIMVRISPSEPAHFDNILLVIKRFHTMLGIQVDFAKSMKVTSSINYKINF
jgi:hypothetical protein